jgi:peptidoglycan/xylan/chitin deacetylase (PgdA/CDA1 family)
VIAVLCYHRVGGQLELGVTRVGRSVFARQMTALAAAGWRTLTLAQFRDSTLKDNAAFGMPHSALLLTFDDGYASLADYAYPVLADLGFTALTFLVTDFVGYENTWDVRYTWRRLRHLDWETIAQWRTRGLEFASHTARHRRLTWLDDQALAEELGRSRQALVSRLGPEAGRAVAYPFGAVDERVVRAARAAGFELGFGGVAGGGGRGDHGSLMHVSRLPVYVWDAGAVPFGLREDAVGAVGRAVARAANRCAIGTSVMRRLAGLAS